MSPLEPPAEGPATYQPEPYDAPGAAAPPVQQFSAYQYGVVHPARRGMPVGWLAAGAVVLVALGLLGYHLLGTGSKGHGAAAPPTPSAVSLAPPTDTVPTMAPGALLESVALQPADVTGGYTVRLARHGSQVRGQVTLDNCGYHFTTEAHRIARRQYEVRDARGRDSGVGNELVAYDSPAEAAKALDEWYTATAHCPTGRITGMPGVRVHVMRNDQDLPGLPVPANDFTVESATLPKGQRLYVIAVLQVRDRYLDAIYAVQRRAPTDSDLRGAALLAGTTGSRLEVEG